MAISTIAMPFIRMESGSNEPCTQKDAVPEVAAASWLKDTLCYTSGTGASTVLNPVLTAGVLCYGQSPDSSVGTGGVSTPPTRLFGTNHFCFDIRDRILEVNIASGTAGDAVVGTANGCTWAGGGTNGVAMAPAQQYGMYRPTSGTYIRYQFVNVNDTATPFWHVVALAPNQAVTDNNPRIWAKVIPTIIQG